MLNEDLRAEIITRMPLATRLTYLAGTARVLMDELAGLLLPCTALLVFPSSLPVPSLHPASLVLSLCLPCLSPLLRSHPCLHPLSALRSCSSGDQAPCCFFPCPRHVLSHSVHAANGHAMSSFPVPASMLWRVYCCLLPLASRGR